MGFSKGGEGGEDREGSSGKLVRAEGQRGQGAMQEAGA